MYQPIQLAITIPRVKTPFSRSPLWRGPIPKAFAFVLVWLAASPIVRAVSPPPDGDYPDGNTAEGEDALFSLTTGINNTAIGFHALYSNTDRGYNTAIGWQALSSNTSGSNNTASGANALQANTSGDNNTASGDQALLNNTTGEGNTANGVSALYYNTTGSNNAALGRGALLRNTTGLENTATGFNALEDNRTGSYNTANGFAALGRSKTGSYNIALGFAAGFLRETGSNNIDIGNPGSSGGSGRIRIGTKDTHQETYIAGIYGTTLPRGIGVLIDAKGQLGTAISSERFKEEIRPMAKASEAIFSLQPVSFYYKHDLDPESIPQFGLVAEQVERVDPNLVARDDEGKPYTVRYEAVNAMLLNEFLKEHRKVQEQGTTITELKSADTKQEATLAELKSTVAQQQKEIKALTTSLQKVSEQLDVSKTAPQAVANN